MSHPKRITLNRIAEDTGYSRATVSLALRHDPQIPAATRERIQLAALALGYVPDAKMQRLMAHVRADQAQPVRGSMGVLHTAARAAQSRLPSYGEWMAGAAERAAAHGYSLDEFWLTEEPCTPRRLETILATRGTEALLLPCPADAPQLDPAFLPLLARHHAVVIGYPHPSLRHLASAANDRFATGALLFAKALAAGCRRIGVVLHTQSERPGDRRFCTAVCTAAFTAGLHATLPVLVCEVQCESDFAEWYGQHRPDCVISACPEAERWLKALGVRVPQKVTLLSWQIDPRDRRSTGARQNDHAVGATAVDLLVAQLHRGADPETGHRTLVQSHWIDRFSSEQG